MTGIIGVFMWLMMGVMGLGVISGGIVRFRRRLKRRHDSRAPVPAPADTDRQLA